MELIINDHDFTSIWPQGSGYPPPCRHCALPRCASTTRRPSQRAARTSRRSCACRPTSSARSTWRSVRRRQPNWMATAGSPSRLIPGPSTTRLSRSRRSLAPAADDSERREMIRATGFDSGTIPSALKEGGGPGRQPRAGIKCRRSRRRPESANHPHVGEVGRRYGSSWVPLRVQPVVSVLPLLVGAFPGCPIED